MHQRDISSNEKKCYSTLTTFTAIVAYSELNRILAILQRGETIHIENMASGDAFRFLEENFSSSPFIKNIEPQFYAFLEETIKGLSSGIEHWKQANNNILFLLNCWLRGRNPPPRCQAPLIDGSLCLEEADAKSDYCSLLHKCKSQTTCQLVRLNQLIPFCLLHFCAFDNRYSNDGKQQKCQAERFSTTSFCSKHVCVGCLLNNSKIIKSGQPRACENHKCVLKGCIEAQMFPHR